MVMLATIQSRTFRLSSKNVNIKIYKTLILPDRLCGLVIRVPGYRSRSPASISGATRFSEK
jgi:hypothetical protein